MVLGVCRQVVREPHGADDAFQATFLVLVRKARSVRVRGSLAPWLYGVAVRTARRARADASRYRVADAEQIEVAAPPQEDAHQFDLRPLLLEELGRLPGKYREPIVLCHLQGKTHQEAALLLQWPVGTVSGRLSRGRQLLKSRLERRGLLAPSLVLATPGLVGIRSALTPPLAESALKNATRFAASLPVPSSVLHLTQGVLRTMLLHKLKTAALISLVVGISLGGAGVWAHWPSQSPAEAIRRGGPGSNPTATPVDKASLASQPSTGAPSLSDGDVPADCPCPVFGSASCPLTMAANSLARVFSHLHDDSATSR
jgi:RNA polymerase sigma factor (sigma-70 family)